MRKRCWSEDVPSGPKSNDETGGGRIPAEAGEVTTQRRLKGRDRSSAAEGGTGEAGKARPQLGRILVLLLRNAGVAGGFSRVGRAAQMDA